MIGLKDLKGPFQPKEFYESNIYLCLPLRGRKVLFCPWAVVVYREEINRVC